MKFCLFLLLSLFSSGVFAESLRVAVASNLLPAIKEINQRFEAATSHKVKVSSGSTSRLTAQILNGAPFDILLGANEREPLHILKQLDLTHSAYSVYAQGRVVLLASKPVGNDVWASLLQSDSRLVIANPKLAPYGLAARQTLQYHGIWEGLGRRVIHAENIAQAYQYVVSQQVTFGFVAMSQVAVHNTGLNYVVLPSHWHQPIRQGMLRITDSASAMDYFTFMLSEEIQNLLGNKYGYSAVSE